MEVKKIMPWLGILFLIKLASAIYQFQAEENINRIIDDCITESIIFAQKEEKYEDKRYHPENEPNFAGMQFAELQFIVYEKEKLQRPFECISDRITGTSSILLEGNAMYQELVRKCKSGQPIPYCDFYSPYRNLDGTCNNLLNPKWGSTFSCLRRLMPPRYEGTSGFRRSVSGESLPNSRLLSLAIQNDRYNPNHYATQMLVFFGQYVAHDVADTPSTFIGNKSIDCCSHPYWDQHPQCAPIFLKEEDPFYSHFNVTCFDFVRYAMCDSCSVGKRKQINQGTSFLDLSMTYGSITPLAQNLRRYDGTGKLKAQPKGVGDLLPANFKEKPCGEKGTEEYCFASGDHRVNQHTVLSSIETLLMREHNRIAERLKDLNPQWGEEILFLETRKILTAVFQKIVYEEYLPNVIGDNLMAKYRLFVQTDGRTVYDPSIDPTIVAEFNGAAYRLHSLLNSVVTYYKVEQGKRRFKNESLDVSPLYHGMMDSLLKGVTLSPAKEYGNNVIKDMTNYLYRKPKGSYGFDIVSVHIQRGRDLGFPPYKDVVRYITGGQIDLQNFEDLMQYMSPRNVELLSYMYSDVKDIDLWVGLNSENVPNGMLVGPTAGEIIAEQFSRLKFGDRFYFEHEGQFTDDKLQSIRESSMSRMMCDNLKIQSIQENPFIFQSFDNPVWPCEDIPGVNLELWKV